MTADTAPAREPGREAEPEARRPDADAQLGGSETRWLAAERRRRDRRQVPRQPPARPAPTSASARGAPSRHPAEPGGWPADGEQSQLRILRVYLIARVVVAAALVGVQFVGAGLGLVTSWPMSVIAGLYAVQALGLWLVPRLRALMAVADLQRHAQARWLLTIGVDLLAFFALHVLQSEAASSYTALLVLPVLMAGVLSSRVLALGTAAAVSLMLLAVGSRAAAGSPEGMIVLAQQGFTGIGFFVIALLTSELTTRLVREERAAAGSLEMARRQAELNRLVLDEMAEGVLVVDRRLCVQAANPAARMLVAGGDHSPAPPYPLAQETSGGVLVQAVEGAFQGEAWPEAGRLLELRFPDGAPRSVIVRMRFTRGQTAQGADGQGQAAGEDYCVLFLEDARTVQARARQDKLAAMGRMSAGIAHEIRNPLAAIAQANQLLGEEVGTPGQQQLSRMVDDNVRRLQRIVGDVLEAVTAPGRAEPSACDARSVVSAVVADWMATASGHATAPETVRLDLPAGALPVMFDAEHLRRVLVNLLDNARRHGSGGPGSIQLRLARRDDASAVIALASDGAPIPPAVERHLFEPFFSTRSRGSGLGLYICRELCERHGASIEFRLKPPDERHCNVFVIVMRRPAGLSGSEVGES
jgi:two-component system sensor histidine kinase PilS (NtrC family)